jgi:hypothetical protein
MCRRAALDGGNVRRPCDGRGPLVTGREHDGRIRTTRWPRSKPPTSLFNVSGPSRGRPETPQPFGHSRDLMVGYMDLAVVCCRQGRHGWGSWLWIEQNGGPASRRGSRSSPRRQHPPGELRTMLASPQHRQGHAGEGARKATAPRTRRAGGATMALCFVALVGHSRGEPNFDRAHHLCQPGEQCHRIEQRPRRRGIRRRLRESPWSALPPTIPRAPWHEGRQGSMPPLRRWPRRAGLSPWSALTYDHLQPHTRCAR